jgi:hypothetical protein
VDFNSRKNLTITTIIQAITATANNHPKTIIKGDASFDLELNKTR